MEKINYTGFLSLFGALVLTTVAFEFFPDPYSYDILKQQGLSDEEIRKRFITYTLIGLILLFVTTALFYKVIKSSRI